MGRSNKGKQLLDRHKLVKTGVAENLRLPTGPDPPNNTLGGLSTESSPDLGRSPPSAMGQKLVMK